MILELFLWWFVYGFVFALSFGFPGMIARDLDSKLMARIILVLFTIPVNGLFFERFTTCFYMKWFL